MSRQVMTRDDNAGQDKTRQDNLDANIFMIVVTHKRKLNAKNLVIKIMRDEVDKATESDPNKLIVDYVSGG